MCEDANDAKGSLRVLHWNGYGCIVLVLPFVTSLADQEPFRTDSTATRIADSEEPTIPSEP
jgi:hypothetical protein